MNDSVAASAQWSWRLALAGMTAMVLGPTIAHLGIVPAIAGFVLFGLSGLLSLIAAVVGLIGVFRNTGASRARAVRGLGLGAALLAIFVLAAMPGGKYPRINDIATDTDNPPTFIEALKLPANQGRDMRYPGAEFAAQQHAGYPDLGPLKSSDPPDVVFERVRSVAASMPTWAVTSVTPATRTIEGIDTSRLFRFQDDFVIVVRPDGTGSAVHMRSKSRDGKGDIGANAARIRAFFEKLRG